MVSHLTCARMLRTYVPLIWLHYVGSPTLIRGRGVK